MPLTNQIAAYDDCFDIWARALDDPIGTRVLLANERAAGFFQMRMNHARKLEREQSTRVYPRTDPKWNTSQYDKLVVRIKPSAEDDGTYWVYIERHGQNLLDIESLSESNDAA